MVSNFKRWLHRYVKNTKRTLIPLAVLEWYSDVTGRQTAWKIFSLSNRSDVTLRTSYHHSKISYQNCSLRKVVNERLHQRCLTEGAVLSMRWFGLYRKENGTWSLLHWPSESPLSEPSPHNTPKWEADPAAKKLDSQLTTRGPRQWKPEGPQCLWALAPRLSINSTSHTGLVLADESSLVT